MKTIINSIQEKLKEVTALQYIDEDWGQLDEYAERPPVKWPCAVIDMPSIAFSNIGIDKKATPINRQQAETTVSITIANLRLTNSSNMAPAWQKQQAVSIWSTIEQVHEILQGFHPTDNSGALIRIGLRRVERYDGVQQYRIDYSLGINNV